MSYTAFRFLLLFALFCLLSPSKAWRLEHRYDSSSWNRMMDTEQGLYELQINPNQEFARFLNAQEATHRGLVREMANRAVYVGVDSQNVTSPDGPGRDSVRFKSRNSYGHDRIFIGDFKHMPEQACGTWPSFFLVGPNWPTDGEIDIIEGVDNMRNNQITIHSGKGCIPRTGPEGQSGVKVGNNDDCGAGIGDIGCAVSDKAPTGLGRGLNSAGGGVYAVLWEKDQIRVWHWARGGVPYDIQRDRPTPGSWGKPAANWVGCAFDQFREMHFVLLTAFCGNWAGGDGTWGDPNYGSCSNQAPNCRQFVSQNPQAFRETYWIVNSIKTFTE